MAFDSGVSSHAFSLGGLSGTGNLSLQTGGTAVALTVGGNSLSTTYSGALSGLGSLTKVGSGALWLAGANNYSGVTTVNGGMLEAASTGALSRYGTPSSVSVGSGGMLTLAVGGSGWTAGNVGTFLIANSSGFNPGSTLGLDTTNGNFVYGGFGGNSMGLAVLGWNTLTLTSASSFGGPTWINGATLQLGDGSGHDGSLSSTAGITNNGALVFNLANPLTYAAAISGTGSLTTLGTNVVTLTGTNSYAGQTTISAGTLQLGDGNGHDGVLSAAGGIYNNSSLVYNLAGSQTYAGVISGGGSLTKTGSNLLVLTGQNAYWGPTNITGGTLQVGNGTSGYDGSLATSNIAVANSAALVFDLAGSQTFSGNLNGAGTFTKAGNGTLVLFGTNGCAANDR